MRFDLMSRIAVASMALAVLAGQATAEEIYLRGNSVVPVVMDDELSFKESRTGDRFFARVEDTRDLPYGTRLEGRIVSMQRKRGDKPAFMDVEFDSLVLPDGSSKSIRAVPIPLGSKYVGKGRDGRLVAKQGAIRKDYYVWGGVVGGAILGSIIGRKTFEGAFIGGLAGIILAEGASKEEGFALKRGARLGALIEEDVKVDYSGRWEQNGYNGRYDRRTDPFGYNRRRGDDQGDGDTLPPRNGDADRQPPNGRYDQRNQDSLIQEDGEFRIESAGRRLRFGVEQPYRIGETVMVPLERAASQMGLDVEIGGNIILIEGDDMMIRLEQDSDQYRLNGRRGSLSRNIVKRKGVIYVPIEVLALTKRDSVYLNGNKVRNIAL